MSRRAALQRLSAGRCLRYRCSAQSTRRTYSAVPRGAAMYRDLLFADCVLFMCTFFYFGESGVAGRPGCGPLLLTGGAALAGHRVRGQPARAALHALPRTRWGCLPARASGRRRPAAVSLAPAALTRGALLFVIVIICLTG